MNKIAKLLFSTLLPVTVITGALLLQPVAQAKTDRLIIENGNQASGNEAARQSREQWDDTRSLRKKVNSRTEKEFNRADQAIDTRDACEKSFNNNLYWEPGTLRCLDRRTGRPTAP